MCICMYLLACLQQNRAKHFRFFWKKGRINTLESNVGNLKTAPLLHVDPFFMEINERMQQRLEVIALWKPGYGCTC